MRSVELVARYAAVALVVAVAIVAGCQPASSNPKAIAARFVTAVFEGDSAAAASVANSRLDDAALRDLRAYVTGDGRIRKVTSVMLTESSREPNSATYVVREIVADPAIDAQVLNETGLSVNLVRWEGKWAVVIP